LQQRFGSDRPQAPEEGALKNRIVRLMQGFLAAWITLLVLGGGFELLAPGNANGASVAGKVNVAGPAGQAFDDDTGSRQESNPPDTEDGSSSGDETPRLDETPEPPIGGCIFDRKPLQLMV
jgi:hypothetical protein